MVSFCCILYFNLGYIKIRKPGFKERIIHADKDVDSSLIAPKEWQHYLPLFRTLEGDEIIPENEQRSPIYLVIADLHKLGYYMTSGSYFGCELLVYDGHPNTRHVCNHKISFLIFRQNF